MIEILDDYDWREAFCFASGKGNSGGYSAMPQAVLGSPVATDPFDREDVAEVLGLALGENDGPEWLIAGRLHDGRFFYIEAGCDYTGWDCHSGGSSYVATSREDLILLGITPDNRERLGLASEGEASTSTREER